jgi:DNA-binding MarR family transcriptional regulator
MRDFISILGIKTELFPIERNQLQGLNVDMLLRFAYYSIEFNGQRLCIIKPKENNEPTTPLKYRKMTEHVEVVVGMPVAVSLDSLHYYERERLIKQGVYFIISDKYAFLPSLIINAQTRKNTKSDSLLSVSQYILLYYLLSNEKEFTIKDLEKKMLYNYVALARAVTNLEDCKLCYVETDSTRTKYIRFKDSKRELWEKAQSYLSSPVKKVLYCDSIPNGDFNISGVNALSHYSHLNPEEYGTVAIWEKQFNPANGHYNEIEGLYKIEVWKYPTTMPYKSDGGIVDKLSLFLSMKNDPDSRIEKELEIMIEEMKW